MRFGLFGMNVCGGLIMTKTPQWYPTFKKISQKLTYIENTLNNKHSLAFVPICRWKGYSGEIDIAGDSIESISLSSYLLSQTKKFKIFGTFSTFAYEPELIGHVASRLNYEFDQRFGLNIVGGWKKDEYEYFRKQFLDSSKKVYEFASIWTDRFRKVELSHFNTFNQILNKKLEFSKSELICAGFSPEGREFARKYADSLFTTITKSEIKKDKNYKFSSAISLFIRNTINESEEYYDSLLKKSADIKSANNFCQQLSDSNPLKGFLNKKNINLVKSGAGIEELITDKLGLLDFLKIVKDSGIYTLLFALPDYEKSLDILLEVLLEM